MCLYPKLIQNKRYLPNKKNGGKPPKCDDPRKKLVPAACGRCKECRQKKCNEWSIRAEWELKTNPVPAHGVTLTFADEYLDNEDVAELDPNDATYIYVRRFVKRWVKKHKKAPKYWLVPEFGEQNSERLHIHGIIWTDHPEDIEPLWKYGNVKIEQATIETIGYALKYCLKPSAKNKNFLAKIRCSNGIGAGFIGSYEAERLKNNKEGSEYVKNAKGFKKAVPIYWRNKLYSEEERDTKWTTMLDKNERWVCGERIDLNKKGGEREYLETVRYYQGINKRMGYGCAPWDAKEYKEKRKLLIKKQLKN